MFLKILRQGAWLMVYLFALIGFVLVMGFLALRFGWTKTPGAVDFNDRYFQAELNQIRQTAGTNSAQAIFANNRDKLGKVSYAWMKTPDWAVLKEAIAKDEAVIEQVSTETGVPSRLIVGILVGEQLRLYTSEREVFKQFFQPLKILGVQSQFSWGVMGMKEETAKQIELNLKDKNSPFYLGASYENLLDFKTEDVSSERFNRLIDSKNHRYSYLYTALFLKQIMHQWELLGYNISNRPEVLATLFNLGFNKSIPKAEPQVGGAEIDVGGEKYSFGGLAFQFYYSDELLDYFPWQ
ncbi:MAG: hypothetical protein WCV68_01425 [Candidatus Paceibacterota bacterium]|jgi:hypothetical protein